MIQVRNYTHQDYSSVEGILRQAEMFDILRDSRDNLCRKIELDPDSVIIATDEGTVVGSVYTIYDGVFAFIFRLAVREDYQERGIGSALLQEAEKRLVERGAKRISLWIRQSELARLQPFYEKRGYFLAEGMHQCMYKEF